MTDANDRGRVADAQRSSLTAFARGLLVVLAVLGLAELGARVIEPKEVKPGPTVLGELADLWAVQRPPGRTVVLGGSDAAAAIDPQQLNAAAPAVAPVFNAGVEGMPLDLLAQWRRALASQRRPDTVILAVSALAGRDTTGLEIGGVDELRATLDRLTNEGATGFAHHFALWRLRAQLDSPTATWELIRQKFREPTTPVAGASGPTAAPTLPAPEVEKRGPDGSTTRFRASATPAELARQIAQSQPNPSAPGNDTIDVSPLSTVARSGKGRVIVVLLPSAMVQLPKMRTAVDAGRRAWAAAATSSGVAFIDLTDLALPSGSFHDPLHVSAVGAAAVTAEVARRV